MWLQKTKLQTAFVSVIRKRSSLNGTPKPVSFFPTHSYATQVHHENKKVRIEEKSKKSTEDRLREEKDAWNQVWLALEKHLSSARYKAILVDTQGGKRHSTTIQNDGDILTMELDGIVYQSRDFHHWTPRKEETDAETKKNKVTAPQPPDFGGPVGKSFELFCDIPIRVLSKIARNDENATLHVHQKGGGDTRPELRLSLVLNNGETIGPSSGRHESYFDGELLELQNALARNSAGGTTAEHKHGHGHTAKKEDRCIKTCFTCRFSCYNPDGHRRFGDLACFRDHKKEFLQATSRHDLQKLWESRSGMVQETYLCDQYQRRNPGTGPYRA